MEVKGTEVAAPCGVHSPGSEPLRELPVNIRMSVWCLLLVACSGGVDADLAIRDVTIVNVADGSLQPDQTVLVKGNRIVFVGPTDDVKHSDSIEVVDGSGGFLIPGLWDTHVHSAASAEWHFPLFLSFGITSVRNMHTTVDDPLALVLMVKQQLAEGILVGPRVIANGGIVDGDPPVWPGSHVVRNAQDARDAVDSLARGGADFIKVYDNLSLESYLAVMNQARQRGIPVDGHLPWLVPPEDAAAAGQRTFEHTSGISTGCASEADALRTDYAQYLEAAPGMSFPEMSAAYIELVRRLITSRDPELCAQTVAVMREHGVVAVPTLVISAGNDAQSFVNDTERMALLPQAVRDEWQAMSAGQNPFAALNEPELVATVGANVRLLNDSGVVILAGTDVGNPFLLPGLSLHNELVRLHGAGLSPLQALQAATLLPPRVFGMADSLGTIEAGMLADLVLLDANPLENIASTRQIRAVVANGRLVHRADIDSQ